MDVMYVLVFIKCDSGFIDLFTDVTFQALKKENSFDDNKMFHVDDQFNLLHLAANALTGI